MKQALFAMLMLPLLAAVAQARPIDWQAELDRCRAMREQTEPLLLAAKVCHPSRAPGRRRVAALASITMLSKGPDH